MRRLCPWVLLAAALAGPAMRADEGMWLFNAPPRAQLEARYGFELTDAWLDRLMRASARVDDQGSGCFVSADGLLITNYHVTLHTLQRMSSAERNYVRDGFCARTQAEELGCAGLQIDVLQSIEDVTGRVNAAVPASLSESDSAAARRRVFAEIEKESVERTGLKSEIVILFQGGRYHLYRYRSYTDVRLVFAPEFQAAFFGGDPDNFEFPRYNLDVCLFRVYERGRPAHPPHLRWSPAGPKDGELVFVSGHPGRTQRLFTVSELQFLRDARIPRTLALLKRREVLLDAWGARADENARRAKDDLFTIRNSRKVYDGELAVLQDPGFMAARQAQEDAFKRRAAGLPAGAAVPEAFRRITRALEIESSHYLRYRYLELEAGFLSDSFVIARTLLRSGDERAKPEGERLREYADARRPQLELGLFSDKPIYADYEILKLGDSLTDLAQALGSEDPLVRRVLAGKSPRDRAAELILETRVRDPAFRRRLYRGGRATVAAARDPLIEVARAVDAQSRSLRSIMEAQEEACQEAHAAIGRARSALREPNTYPDATFTLRLAFGTVKGYPENGAWVAPVTDFAGLCARSDAHHGREPFDLAPSWRLHRAELDPSTPLNFATTCDVTGGNSGSPTVNRAGEVVGIVFDGNIYSLSNDFGYSDAQCRALSVASPAILEALRKVYHADALANELLTGHR